MREQEELLESIVALKNDEGYLKEMVEITERFNAKLPCEKDEWWNKAKS